MPVQIRQAVPDDLDALFRLAYDTFVERWAPHYTSEDMALYLKTGFIREQMAEELESPDACRYFISNEGDTWTGYAKVMMGSHDARWQGKTVAEIERFYLFREFHGQGMAQALMDHILEVLEQHSVEWVYLGVDVNNHRAIRFYEKYGFRQYGHKPFPVGSVIDMDQLMERKVRND